MNNSFEGKLAKRLATVFFGMNISEAKSVDMEEAFSELDRQRGKMEVGSSAGEGTCTACGQWVGKGKGRKLATFGEFEVALCKSCVSYVPVISIHGDSKNKLRAARFFELKALVDAKKANSMEKGQYKTMLGHRKNRGESLELKKGKSRKTA